MNQVYTLYELNRLLRAVIEDNMEEEYWVEGELSEARQAGNGHFYGELVQKDAVGKSVVARASINCWARVFNILSLRFRKETGESLRAGLRVKLLVRVTFHELYGYALNVQDIDSAFTMGDVARQRAEILQRLEACGILHDNQELPLPRLLQRVAVVSSATAAGYGDFCNQLEHNDYGLAFTWKLFPAVMQGKHVPESILSALDMICQESDQWDVVVIIRGGGASSDLSDFDSYELAEGVAQFPLPVLVGIGHERDETVLDFVAHTRVKTPTAAAAFLIDYQAGVLAELQQLQQRIVELVQQHLHVQHMRLEHLTTTFPVTFAHYQSRRMAALDLLWERIMHYPPLVVERQRHRLQLLQQQIESHDPMRLLRRGYSITTCGGRVLKDAASLRPGDLLETRLRDGGIVRSIVQDASTTDAADSELAHNENA